MIKPIKIAFIIEATIGGTGRHITDILMLIDLKKFKPHLIVSNLRDPSFNRQIELFKERGIEVDIVSMRREINLISDYKMYNEIKKILLYHNFDIIHTHSSKAGILGRYAAKKVGVKKIIHTPHVFSFEMLNITTFRKHIYIKLEKMAARFTDKLIAVCESEKEIAIAHKIIPETKIKIIHNGIDIHDKWTSDKDEIRRELNISKNDFLIGSLGRMTDQKGYKFFIEAASKLYINNKNLKFIIVGNGESKNQLMKQIDGLNLGRCFKIFDETKTPAKFLKSFDAFILPSLWEGLPYILLEAMAAKLPIIATSVGGVSELIKNEVTGLLIPPANSIELEMAILKLINDTTLCSKIAAAAEKEVIACFSINNMIIKLEELYSNLL